MAVAFLILLTAIVLLITWWYIELFKWNRYLGKYPGPRPLPLIGHAHYIRTLTAVENEAADFLLQRVLVTDIVPVLMELREKYGGIIKVFLGIQPRLVITDYKAAEFLLGSTTITEKSYDYKYFHPWLGTGLLTSSSDKWKRQRKLLTPTFHFQILEQFLGVFDFQSDILVKKLKKEIEEKPFDIFPYITLCTLDVICEATMGTSVNAQDNSDSEYVQNVKEMCRIIVDRACSPVKMWDSLFPFSRDYRKQKKVLSVLHGYTNHVITKRREELANSNNMVANDDGIGSKKRLAFLDLLLQCKIDGEQLPNEIVREEVDTFMFEGHDTTASGLSFTLYLLSKYPEIQGKVVNELRNIFADDKSRSPTYKDLQNMKYLELVIKESLRLFPPVPLHGRILEQDVEFDGGVLPKGVTLTMFSYGLHRQVEMFPDPEKFDPERFSLENSAGRSPFSYVPFSAGPRNCIGQKFALLELKSTISKVLRNFELMPVFEHQPVLSIEIILKSANGLLIRLKKRDF